MKIYRIFQMKVKLKSLKMKLNMRCKEVFETFPWHTRGGGDWLCIRALTPNPQIHPSLKYYKCLLTLLDLLYFTSGTVMELSAMLVETTILRLPGKAFLKTFLCSSIVKDEWRGRVSHLKRKKSLSFSRCLLAPQSTIKSQFKEAVSVSK